MKLVFCGFFQRSSSCFLWCVPKISKIWNRNVFIAAVFERVFSLGSVQSKLIMYKTNRNHDCSYYYKNSKLWVESAIAEFDFVFPDKVIVILIVLLTSVCEIWREKFVWCFCLLLTCVPSLTWLPQLTEIISCDAVVVCFFSAEEFVLQRL